MSKDAFSFLHALHVVTTARPPPNPGMSMSPVGNAYVAIIKPMFLPCRCGTCYSFSGRKAIAPNNAAR